MKNIKLIISFSILSILLLLSFSFNIFQQIKIKKQTSLIRENINLLKQKEEILSKKDEKINMLNNAIEQHRKSSIEKQIEQNVQECMKEKNYTTAGMSYCVYKSEDEWNKQISKHLNGLKKVLTKEEYKMLIDCETKWLAYKNSQDLFIKEAYSKTLGTIYQNFAAADIVYPAEERAKYLSWLLEIMNKRFLP